MTENVRIVGELRSWRKHTCAADGSFVYWGFIYDDALNRFPDGHWIHTSRVLEVVEDLVFTSTGNAYKLVGEAGGPEINLWQL